MEKYVLTLRDKEGWEEAVKKLLEIEEIEEVYMVTGPEDLVVFLSVETEEALNWVMEKIRNTGKVEEVRVSKILEEHKLI